jgi:diguanylate cyclase (GGDEF)-like protein
MKLKSKLIVSFTTVVLAALTVFGAIVYYSMAVHENAEATRAVSVTGPKAEDGVNNPLGKIHRATATSRYNASLVSLRNRLITALLVVGWCAVWIILILAHSIANPIRKLTKSTQDIIAFDYSSELDIKPGHDEIGELAVNFETMRLKIKDLVTRDQLTHVYNRRFLMHVFELAVLKALRLNEDLCCMMLDIDHFKKINDTYGHPAGDAVLVAVSKLLLDQTRDYDTPARYGGEEFILVLPDTDLETAHEIAERIRKTMQNQVINFEDQQINCTASIGVSRLDKDTANTTEQIIKQADNALYKAKGEGRNRTVIYED